MMSHKKLGLAALLLLLGCSDSPRYNGSHFNQESARHEPSLPPYCLAENTKDRKPNHKKPGKIKIYYDRDSSALSSQDKQNLEALLTTIPPNTPLTITGYADRWGNIEFNQRLATKRAECARDYLLNSYAQRNLTPPSVRTLYELTRGSGTEYMAATITYQQPRLHAQNQQRNHPTPKRPVIKVSPEPKQTEPSALDQTLAGINTPHEYDRFLRERGIHHFGEDPETPENDRKYRSAHYQSYGSPKTTLNKRGGVCDELATLSAAAALNFSDTARVELVEISQNSVHHAFTIRQTQDGSWYYMNNTNIDHTAYTNKQDAIFAAAQDTGYDPHNKKYKFRYKTRAVQKGPWLNSDKASARLRP